MLYKRVSSIYLIVLLLFLSFNSNSQNPLKKQWDRCLGGFDTERLFSAPVQTVDNGFLICGYSNSGIGGDKTQLNWGSATNVKDDYWIIRIDSLGNKLWDKRFGGYKEEYLYFALNSSNGTFLLVGGSGSPVSGDVTNINWTGVNDGGLWIIKIDSLGNKIWDKGYKVINDSYLLNVISTNDNGYLIAFTSRAGAGGLKTDSCRGDYDYWIVKLDSSGNKQWDKTYGGTKEDYIGSVAQSSDGGYLLGGGSVSPIGGEKTSDISGFQNRSDMWLIKVDSIGNKIWDKVYGGSLDDGIQSIKETSDGNYLLFGGSSSPADGNKTALCKDTLLFPLGDYWIVKIDSGGNKIWDKSYGGFSEENIAYGNFEIDQNNGFIMSGVSYSNAGADKSENNLITGVNFQPWVVKADSLGNKLWDKTVNLDFLFGGYSGRNYNLKICSKNCFVLQTSNNGKIIGEKSQHCWDTVGPFFADDYWVVKYCDTSFVTGVKQHTINEELFLQAYPNPFANKITISINRSSNLEANCTYSVVNSWGQIILHESEKCKYGYWNKALSAEKFNPGIYFLSVQVDGKTVSKKIIKY
jgi:Secretion system C-terminal sorting domain